jgi:hypothetical protein
MSERQEDKREQERVRRLAEFSRLWQGVDPAAIERRVDQGLPAGFGAEFESYVPGQTLTPQQVQSVLANLTGSAPNTRGVEGGAGLTLDSYMADPRAAIKVENGQYVFRPELAQGDYFGINPTGFWDGMGPAALAVALAGGLPMLTSMGVLGGGAAAAGAGETGIGGWAGAIGEGGTLSGVSDLGWNVAGLAGEGAGAGALDGINWASDIFNPDALSTFTGDTSAGWNVAGTSGGTGGIADGINWASDIFDPNAASGFTGDASAGWNVAQTAGGTGGAAGLAQTAAQQAAKTGLSKVLKDTLGIDVDSSTLDLIGKGLGLGLGVYGSNKQADAAKDLASQYMGMGAPYRAELANLNANPSSFYGSDIFQGALQQGSDALSRSLSAKVGNPILNPTALQEMQNYTTRGSLDAFNTRWNQLASAGQLGVSQAAPLGQQANAASGNTYNALGAGLQSVFGNQRDYAAEFMDLLNKRESRVGSGQSGNVFNLP